MLIRAIDELGIDVALRDPPAGFFPLNRIVNEEGRVAVLHLHWINELVDAIIWSKSALRRSAKIALLKLDFALVRLRGVKVIWTIHNLVAHESNDSAYEIRVRKAIASMCTHVILHSASALALVEKTYDVSLAGKASVTPHGNYDGCYPLEADSASRLRAKFGLDAGDIVILFFGAIRPYKGVERLIDAFRSVENGNLRLLVVGKAESAAFGESLGKLARGDMRIVIALGFVPDGDVAGLFELADVVAIPFERTLTSGSATLAFTMSKALLLPEQARVFDFVNDENAIFFRSDEELHTKLATLAKSRLAGMGRNGRAAVQGFEWKKIAAQLVAVYAK
jgi:beta-1,4-mannosyltransferase